MPQTVPDPPSSAPKRILRRAANLLTTTGRPVVKELVFAPSQDLSKRSRQSRLGSSIKRKFDDVKALARSRSFTVSAMPSRPEAPRRHSTLVPQATRSNTVQIPLGKSHRFSTPPMTTTIPTTTSANPQPADAKLGPNEPATDVTVPQLLQLGTPMTKVSSSKHKKYIFKVDADQGQIVYNSSAKQKIVPIETIKEMRFGADARYDREQFQFSQEYEERWLTIIYILDGNYKSLHLIAPNHDVFNMWNATLRQLHAIRKELMTGLGNVEMRQELWEKHYWKGADEEKDQKLEFSEIEKLCRRLNINSSSDDLRRLFKQADVHNRNHLDFEDFRRFVRILKARPEIDRLYKKIRAGHGGEVDFTAFEQFMRDKQKSPLTTAEMQTVFDKFTQLPSPPAHVEGQTPAAAKRLMSLDSFTAFLLSNENSALVDNTRGIWHDMTRPLSEYYISASHNTYLVGHQLVGVSTIEGYVRALLHSCRSVELDIYDGDKEPMIFHGKTFTSKVSVREVCEAIKKYGFVSSPYPIIISAEIHCGVAQQDMMAEIMISVFGDALIQAPVDGRPTIAVLPSPEELKGKILLKAKNLFLVSQLQGPEATTETFSSTSSSSESESSPDGKQEPKKDTVSELKQEFQRAKNVLQRVGSRSKSPGSPVAPPLATRRASESGAKPKVKMSLALVALLVYTVGVKCRGINKKEEYAPEHIFSLSENMVNKMLKSGMFDLIKHARTHLVRIYPKGLRVSSTNYEPHRYWSAGAQLVALNWQTFDLGYMINHAMFQRNGRCGYVLKPPPLRIPQKDLLSAPKSHFLDISVISAQQLPRPTDASGREIMNKSIIDPFVEVSLHVPDWAHPTTPMVAVGAATSTVSVSGATTVSYRTSVVKNNGFNPVWEEKLRIPFTCVGEMKDLIFVRFEVKHADSDEPLALFCASLGSLQSGYRHLPLHDAQLSQFLFATLFVRINVTN